MPIFSGLRTAFDAAERASSRRHAYYRAFSRACLLRRRDAEPMLHGLIRLNGARPAFAYRRDAHFDADAGGELAMMSAR